MKVEKKFKVTNKTYGKAITKKQAEDFWKERHVLPKYEEKILAFWWGWQEPEDKGDVALYEEIQQAKKDGKQLYFEGEVF